MTPEQIQTLQEMQLASDAIDKAYGYADYQPRLVTLALIAREFLRRLAVSEMTPPQLEHLEAESAAPHADLTVPPILQIVLFGPGAMKQLEVIGPDGARLVLTSDDTWLFAKE